METHMNCAEPKLSWPWAVLFSKLAILFLQKAIFSWSLWRGTLVKTCFNNTSASNAGIFLDAFKWCLLRFHFNKQSCATVNNPRRCSVIYCTLRKHPGSSQHSPHIKIRRYFTASHGFVCAKSSTHAGSFCRAPTNLTAVRVSRQYSCLPTRLIKSLLAISVTASCGKDNILCGKVWQ